MWLKKLFIIMILSLFILPATQVMAEEDAVTKISDQLICQCGCTMVLAACDCGTQEEMVALIEQNLGEGKSEEEILALFVAYYGEQVLASPPKKGLNLVAWILPFAAILAGGGVVYVVLKKWVRQGRQSTARIGAGVRKENKKYRHQLEKELEEFKEEGFR